MDKPEDYTPGELDDTASEMEAELGYTTRAYASFLRSAARQLRAGAERERKLREALMVAGDTMGIFEIAFYNNNLPAMANVAYKAADKARAVLADAGEV